MVVLKPSSIDPDALKLASSIGGPQMVEAMGQMFSGDGAPELLAQAAELLSAFFFVFLAGRVALVFVAPRVPPFPMFTVAVAGAAPRLLTGTLSVNVCPLATSTGTDELSVTPPNVSTGSPLTSV